MADWVYNNPTWLWGTILVAAVIGVACGGLLAFHRLVPLELRQAHNELAGFTVAIVSVVYAVLLAFIAIATWETFSKATDIAEAESDYAGAIYLDSQALATGQGQAIRTAVSRYLSTVISEEWPTQRAGKSPEQGWKPLRDLNTAIATIQPKDQGQAVIEAELLRTWDQLYLARSTRISAAESQIPAVIWWIIFLGGLITIGYTYLFGFHNLRMHLAMTGTVAATLSLVVVLIIALDRPFRGELSISPEAFVMTQGSWAGLPVDSEK